MARLIYSAITSLDGYVADASGNFDWARPSDEVHAFINDLERRIGTYLYGRRMYEVMMGWETAPTAGDFPRVMLDYAKIWQSAEKVVYSTSLTAASTAKTRIERTLDAPSVMRMKASATLDLSIGGPHLAGEAIKAGLVDEIHLFLTPIIVGGGHTALPENARVNLDLIDKHRFDNGVVHLHYRTTS